MAILYTKNTSGAIRKLRNRKPTKEYLLALKKHIKWLKSLGLNINEKGRIVMMKKVNTGTIMFSDIKKDPNLRMDAQYYLKQKFSGGTKPVHNWRLQESKKFTIAPAYNKGGYQVITQKNVKDIGK